MSPEYAAMIAIMVGLLLNSVYTFSIFDIYFTSPLVHGMTPVASSVAKSDPAADRLVLFVADGLRADKIYTPRDDGTWRAPYLISRARDVGSWGVSHTRVPTESRPGHVALIAGFYEDVSAVTKGWQENPVEFDSVFNESTQTWSWGSPDILPMFVKGSTPGRVVSFSYDAMEEDFAKEDAGILDTWVFDRVEKFLKEADTERTAALRKRGVVLFLHLLGIDTNGHAHRPYSAAYLDNIGSVDRGVKRIVEAVERFYNNDGRTAYVFTADHGMSNRGSHGGADPSETETPLITWGSGIAPPVKTDNLGSPESVSWGLGDRKRHDVAQADVAPLMSCLLGIPFPVNNVGIVPRAHLAHDPKYSANCLAANAEQIASQYEVKAHSKKLVTSFFRPFLPLSSGVHTHVNDIKHSLSKGNWEDSKFQSTKLVELSVAGLAYFQTYDRFLLQGIVAMGYLGFLAVLILFVVRYFTSISHYDQSKAFVEYQRYSHHIGSDIWFNAVFSAFSVFYCGFLYMQSAPVSYYVYSVFPIFLWLHALKRRFILFDLFHFMRYRRSLRHAAIKTSVCIFALEMLVLSFFRREIFPIGLIVLGIWPFTTRLRHSDLLTCMGFALCCSMTAIFPTLTYVEETHEERLWLVAGTAVLITGTVFTAITRPYFRPVPPKTSEPIALGLYRHTIILTIVQVSMIYLSVWNIFSVHASFDRREGLPAFNQIVSWVILFVSMLLPLLSTPYYLSRLLSIALALAAPYILLTISYEALFFYWLAGLLYFWFLIEHKLSPTLTANNVEPVLLEMNGDGDDYTRNLVFSDVRTAYIFVFINLLAFFGTGNVASVSSFQMASTYRFLTVFSPFTMGGLLIIKVLVPFVLVCCVFNAVHQTLHVPNSSIFLIVFTFTNVMALNFFFLVQDSGSWLEIGTSISHFVIVSVFVFFLMILSVVARALTGKMIIPDSKKFRHEKLVHSN